MAEESRIDSEELLASMALEGAYWGKNGAVVFGWQLYQKNTNKYLVSWASTLYSALARAKVDRKPVHALLCLIKLRPLIPDLITKALHSNSADEIDVITSVLYVWAKAVRWTPFCHGEAAYWASIMMAVPWVKLASGHTHGLLALHCARWHIHSVHGSRQDAHAYLALADSTLVSVADMNQRARILRGLATLYWDLKMEMVARGYAANLMNLTGLSRDTVAKNLAAVRVQFR